MEHENLLKEGICPKKLSSHDTGSKSAELYLYQAYSIPRKDSKNELSIFVCDFKNLFLRTYDSHSLKI